MNSAITPREVLHFVAWIAGGYLCFCVVAILCYMKKFSGKWMFWRLNVPEYEFIGGVLHEWGEWKSITPYMMVRKAKKVEEIKSDYTKDESIRHDA